MVVTARHSIQRFVNIKISGIVYSGGNIQKQWHEKAIREEEIYSVVEWWQKRTSTVWKLKMPNDVIEYT